MVNLILTMLLLYTYLYMFVKGYRIKQMMMTLSVGAVVCSPVLDIVYTFWYNLP